MWMRKKTVKNQLKNIKMKNKRNRKIKRQAGLLIKKKKT